MNLKYYLRGLGSGIIIATAVLAITYAITNRDANIIQKARELGMVFSEETKENQTKDQPSTSEEDTSKVDESTSGEEQTSDEESTTENKNSDEATTEEATTEKEPTSTVPEDSTTVESTYTITIKRGMTSESVAMIFKNFGVIENQEEFNAYLVDNGYAGFIRVGVYEVTRGDTYENLAKIITGTN